MAGRWTGCISPIERGESSSPIGSRTSPGRPTLGSDNRVVAGNWWTPADSGKPLVSISTEFAEWLGLRLGDQLTFDIAGETVTRGSRASARSNGTAFSPTFSSCSRRECWMTRRALI